MITQQQIADAESNRKFAQMLMIEFRQKNIDEGINVPQALWLHHRMRAWECSLGGANFVVDVINMALSGDVQAACLALMNGSPDEMNQSYHWISQSRLDFLIEKIQRFLGWR